MFFQQQKKKKLKKKNGDIIILHLCDKNLDDMIYISWYRVWQTEIGNYVSFLPTNLKKKKKTKKNFEKKKKTPGDITILHISTKNYGQMM